MVRSLLHVCQYPHLMLTLPQLFVRVRRHEVRWGLPLQSDHERFLAEDYCQGVHESESSLSCRAIALPVLCTVLSALEANTHTAPVLLPAAHREIYCSHSVALREIPPGPLRSRTGNPHTCA